MPVINDDQYLITCLVVFFIANIVGVFFWNWLQERRGISYSILIIGMVSLFAGFFGFFSHRAELLMVFMILMGLALIGVDTISQPGIVEIYNLKLATDLLPFRAVSIVMGGMIGPFLQFSTASLLTPFQFMKFLFIASVLGFGICLYYFIKFPNKRKSIMMRQM